MPIPQLKSNFKRRSIADSDAGFSSRRIVSDVRNKKKKKPGRFLYKKGSSSKSHKTKKSVSGKWWVRFIKRTWPYALGLVFLGGIFIVGLFAYYSKDLPDVGNLIDRSVALSTKIYDSSGEVLLYELHGAENRTHINLEDLPDYVKNATIAIEDKDFYNHSGISLRGIIRGQVMPRLQGKRAQGGSTLTQQFVKNAILTNERRVSRKVKEWILSYQLENKYSKDQILEFYINEIPYGSSAYGVESAAHYYFGKAAKDLTLAEAATLAALPQAPSYYSPYGGNKDALMGRQRTVLKLMVEQGYISEEEADLARAEELNFKQRIENIKAPHFVMYVKSQLEEKYSATMIEQSGWKIITSLDWDLQQKAEATIEEIAPDNLERFEATNAALVSVDVETGNILAMVGSKDYFDDEIDGQVNVVTSLRQPGSSLKPLVYLTAFEKGYRPDTMLFDLETNFASAGEAYEPKNYDLEQRGPVTMRQSLAGSLNIPAVKTLYLAGVHNVTDLAGKFGYTSLGDPDRYGLSLVLGGAEVKLLEHTNAYATFAREGVYKDSVSILKVEDSDGNIIEEYNEDKGRRVIEKEHVNLLNNVLSDNGARAYVFGEANYLTLPDRPAGAKTGTTNDYRDAWLMGFTPNIATGVWVGNNDNTAMAEGASGSSAAAPIWNKYMREATATREVKYFKEHEPEECDKPMVCGGEGQEKTVRIDKMSGKLATEYTPYTQIEEKKFLELHNILYYVNINDPLGEPLSDPNKEPQYGLWEGPVLKWIEEQGYTNESVPTEEDDIHLAHLRPNINWRTPNNNQTIKQASFAMQVTASAPRGVERVEYFVGDQKVGTSYNEPHSYTYKVDPFLSNGTYEIKAIAFDDQDNFSETIRNINLQLDSSARDYNIIWLQPNDGGTISKADLPISIEINIDKPNMVRKIDFYYLTPDDNSHWFTYIDSPIPNNIFTTLGEELDLGVHKLYLVIKDSSGNLVRTPPLIINIVE